MKKQRTVRCQPPVRRGPSHVATPEGTSLARVQLVDMVARLAAEDPARARAFLVLLKKATELGSRSAVSSVLATFDGLTGTIAEAARPSPLRVRPADLADSWNAVGRAIGSSMIKFDERHGRHVG